MKLDDALFRTLVESVGDGVYFVDKDRNILYWNKAAEHITGFASEEIVGKNCASDLLRHVDDQGQSLCRGLCPLAHTMQDQEVRNARVFLHHKDGHRLPVRVVTAAVNGPDGAVIGGVETFQDDSATVAALQEMEDLRRESLICPLTGIGNRRYAEQFLEQRVAEAERSAKPFAVMLADIDHFKAFNDQYGHAVGDVVLKMVGATLRSAMRTYDFVGRWGGEEFLVIMPGLKWHELKDASDRLRLLVERSSKRVSEGKLSVTVSLGACMYCPEDTLEKVVARADELMYRSKEKGRNCVSIPQTAPPPLPAVDEKDDTKDD